MPTVNLTPLWVVSTGATSVPSDFASDVMRTGTSAGNAVFVIASYRCYIPKDSQINSAFLELATGEVDPIGPIWTTAYNRGLDMSHTFNTAKPTNATEAAAIFYDDLQAVPLGSTLALSSFNGYISVNMQGLFERLFEHVDWAEGKNFTFKFMHNADARGTYFNRFTNMELVINYTIPEQDLFDDLDIQEEYRALVQTRSNEDTLSVGEDYDYTFTRIWKTEDTLALTEEYNYLKTVTRNMEDLLSIVDTYGYNRTVQAAMEDVVTVEDIYTYGNDSFDILDIGEEYDYIKGKSRDLIDTIDITESYQSSPTKALLQDTIDFIEEYAYVAINRTYRMEDTISIEEDYDYGLIINRHMQDDLFIIEMRQGGPIGTQTGNDNPTDPYLPTINVELNGPTTGSSAEDMLESISGNENLPDLTGVGAVNGVALDHGTASTTLPTVHQAITLTCASDALTIKIPLYGDREELTPSMINRQTLNGTRKIFRDPRWVTTRIFRYKFDSLTKEEREAVYAFNQLTLGKKMTLVDHENKTWEGYLIGVQAESGEYTRQCGHTTGFEFEVIE